MAGIERHDEQHKAPAPKPGNRKGKSAEELLREEQEVVRDYLPPDSGISEHDAFDELLGIIDGPDAQKLADPDPKPNDAPKTH